MNDRINKLYSLLIDNGYTVQDLGTEDVFRTRMADKENRKQLYDYALSNGHYLGEYDAYEAKFTNPTTQSAEKVADTTSLLKDSPYAAQFAEETPEEKAARELKAQERRHRRRDGINSVFAATMPGMVSNEYVQSQMKADAPADPTEEQKRAAEDERLFKQHLEDSGQIRELYEMRDKAREFDGDIDRAFTLLSPIPYVVSLFNDNLRARREKQNRNKLIAEQADKAIDVYEQATGDRNGVSGLFNAVADEASRISTWDLGMTDLRNAATLHDLSQKDESELTAAEKATLDAIGLASSVMSLYGDEVGMGYKIGQGVPATLSFMGSMALNPAAGYGKKLAGDAVKKFGKDYVKRVAKRAAGDILETGAYVGSVALPQVAANALDRINGSTTYELDDDLNVVYGGQENQETLGNAIWQALGETFIEGYTERVGDYFDPIIGFAKGVTKGIKAGKLSDFAEALVDVKPTATMQNIRRFKEKTLFNGTLSELMEEELGMAMNAFTVGDYTFNKEEAEKEGKTYIFDPETQFTTAMSVGMFSAAINGTEMAANHAYKRKVNKVAEEYGKIAERELGAQFSEMIDGVPSLKERIDNADADEKNRIINDIFANPNLSDKQKQAAATYAVYRQYSQTFNAVQANALNHKADDVKEQYAAYEAGYSSALPAFYNIANAFKEAEQAISDYTEKTGDSSVADAIRLIENNPSEIKNVRDGLTDEQYQLVTNYINNLERYRGAYQGRSDKLEDYVDEYAFALEPAINADSNGNRTITTAIYKDEPVYVLYNDGTNATIMRFNGEKLGEKTPLLTKFLSEIVSHDADQYINDYRQQITGQMNAETENAFEHHPKTQAPQVRLQLQSPEGEVIITAINDNMVEIVPAVYKDGQVQPKEGADPRTITVGDAYAWQDDYYLSMDADQAYANAMAEANNMSAETTENESTSTEQIEQSVSEEVTDGQIAETQPTETESVAPVTPAAPQTARERVPKDEEGNPIYEQTDADTAWDAIVEETEGNVEMAQRVAVDMLEDKKAALAKLQNSKPKKGVTVAEKIANEKAHAAAIAQAQSDVAKWEAIVGTENRRREAAMSEAERYAAEMEQKNISEGLKALGEPQSLEEYVLGQLAGGAYKLRWSDKENGTKGFGSHTGLSTEEMKARLSMIDNKNGLTPEEIAHSIVENMDMSFGEVDVMDVTNMVIDAVATNASRRSMLNGMVESRAELLRQQEIAEQEAKDAWYVEQYHATEEELREYNEYLVQSVEEIYGEDKEYENRIAIFAETFKEYDNEGRDAGIRSSADTTEGLASDREGSSSVGEGEQADRREVLADANGVAEAEDQGVGSSVSEESDVNFIREELENGDVRITGTNSNGQIATVAIERDGKVISVDSYDDGVLFERTDYDENGQATKVTRFNDKGEVVREEQYTNGKKKVYGTKDVSEGEPRGRRSQEKGGIAEARREVGQDVQKRINEYEQQTGWTNGLESREVDIINYVRTLTDKELADFKRNMLDNIKKGKSGRDYVGILNAVRKYDQSGERQYVKDASGIELNQPVSLEKLEQLFSEYNYDEELAILFDRIFPLIQQINPKITFEVIKDGGKDRESVLGDYLLKDNHIRINYHSLYSGYQTSQEKASTIVHEMLHAVAQYAIDANERGIDMPSKLKDAVKSLVNIYNAVKDNPILAEEYGIKDVHEMISELANPEFREKIKQIDVKGKNLWERIKDVFKRLVNVFADVYDVSAYAKAVDALDNLLDNFDGSLYAQMQEFDYEPKQAKADEGVLFREEKKDLVAVHNISEDNLRKVLDMGGLIMPSIAITKADMGHSGYGDISLIFSKETIDPSDRRNKVYGGDAWTPRFPRIGIKLNEKVVSRVIDKVYGVIAERKLRDAYSLSAEIYPTNIEDVISRNGVEGYYGKEWMKLAYLLDSGKKVKIPMKMVDYGDMSETIIKLAEERGMKISDIQQQGKEFFDNNPDFVSAIKEIEDDKFINSVSEEKRDALREAFRKLRGEMTFAHFDTLINMAFRMEYDLEHGGLKQIIDKKALTELIEKKVKTNNADYKKWVDELFDGIVEKLGIRNNRDWYTPSGNQRSWERLYDPATPANILKYMLAQNEQGGGGGFFDSNIMGASAESYGSIDEIREKGKQRLKKLSDEEYGAFSGSVAERMSEICNDFLSPSKRNRFEDVIDSKIDITNAVAKDKTAKGIFKEMKRDYPNFTMEHAKQVEAIVKEIQDYAIGYFEAKPQRIVPMEEVAVAVVPKKTSSDIVEALEAKGIKVVTYSGTEESRKRVVKRESEGVRFREGEGEISDKEVSYQNDPIAKWMGKPRYAGKKAAAFAERERKRMKQAVSEVSEALGLKVNVLDSTKGLNGKKAKAKGWYQNGEIVVVIPNHVSAWDAVQTVLHEGIAHHGLRNLFGDKLDVVLDNIYNNVAPELKAKIDAIAAERGLDIRTATEEYLASLAEDTNFEEAVKQGWWAKIKQYFVKMLHKLGMPGLNLKEELTDNELRYLLWRSYKNLVEPNSYMKPLGYIDDVAKQKELKVGEYSEKEQAVPIVAEMSEAEEWAEVTMQRIDELEARMAQLDSEIAEMEADRDADDESRYDMWEEQLDVLRKQSQEIYDELEGLYSLESDEEDIEDHESEREAEKQRQLYQKRIDNAYLKAVREGDWEEATDLFRQYVLSKAEDEGIVPMDYGVGYKGGAHSSIAKKVKEENPDAIAEAAYQMSIRIPKGSILVPMPSRTGNATYTVKLAEAIAKATDSEVRDVLKGKARMSVYEAKQKGIKMTPEDLGMYTTEELPKGKNIVIIDNVIDKGTTALAAVSAVKGASVVAYAYTLGDKQRAATLKLAEPVTYDDNKRIIPLSQRFNKETDDIRYRMSISEEEFDNTQREAVRSVGIVMPNLGDTEIEIVNVPRHDFTGTGKEAIDKAKEWANSELVGEHTAHEGTDGEFKYNIDEKSVKKFLSGVSTSLSDNLGVHLSVLKKLPSVIDSSIEAEIHADYKKGEKRGADNGVEDKNLLIHRLYGCVRINGELYRVKTTLKERKSAGVRPYTYEVIKIELLNGSSQEGTSSSDASSNSISGAKLLKGVEKSYDKGKLLLDESKKVSENSINSEEIITEVERESAALGVPVRIARSVDEIPDEDTRNRAVDGKLKGYYDPRTNEVVLYAPNTDDANDAKRTILHEIVGHKGLRQLIGEQRYDKAMLQLMYMLPADVRDAVLRRAERHGWNAAIAMDEYLAEQAERDVQPTWWGKVNAKIRTLLRNMGFNVMLTDADVTYLLWRSRKKLQGDTAFDMATDAILKQAARKSAEADAWNEQAFKDVEMRDFERNALPSIRHRMGADTNDYEKTVRTLGFKQSEAWQDSMRSLLVFQQALAKASGKDISDFENAYMYENRMSSANLMEMEQYRHMVYNPLLKEIHELEQMGASREDIINYLFAKSGLERNEVFARRDAKKHAEGDAAKEQKLYDKYRQKDYAGLTALTRGDAQIAALVDDHSDKKTKYDRLEQNKKRGVAVSDTDLKAAKKEMDDARKAMITAIEAEAQRMVDEFERARNTDNLWDKIRNCTHTTLNISHDAGVMSDEVYDELWNQFQYYIPLRGFAETTAEDVYLYLGGSDSPYNAPIKTAYGRTSLADDPIATIGNMAESAIVEANRNRLKQRFLYMVERHDTDLASISDVWLEYDEVNEEWHTVFAQIPDDATPSEAKRLQQEFEDRMKQLAEQNPGKYANASQQPNIPYRVVKKGDRQEHHVIVKRNGKDVVITINGNPRVAQAINGLTNPEQNQGMITRITSWINRNLSANFTMRNPAFMVSNFVRDGFYTNSMVWVKENPAYAWQYNQNWMKCTAQIASLVSRYKRYEKGDTSALDMNNDMDRMFYEFMINGGETGYTVIKSVEDYKGLISGEMKKMEAGAMGTARRVAGKISDVVDTFGRWAEDTSRFAAYMTSRQLGRTITKSIWDAKEISVNFNKKGSGNRMMGKFEQGNRLNYVLSNMSQLGRNLYVFWNAGVQGFNNFKKAAKDSPAKFTAMAGTYFTLGVIVAAAFSGDDDEDDYYNLPEYVRRNNICFKIGKGKYATLPLPIEIRAIYGLGELAYSYLSGREGLTHGEAVTKTIQQMTQVMPIDMMADGGGAMAFVPSAAKPVVEVIHNVDWTGRPIYKEKTPWNQNDPTWTLAFKSTNPELVKMSRRVNEWTNKNTADGLERPYNRGWADNRYLNNPAVWEHIAEGYLGGMATMFNQSVKSTMALWNEDLREVRNVPIVSRFVKDAGKEGRSYAARNEYYEAKNIMDSWRNEMSKAKKEVLDGSLNDQQRVNAAKLRSSLEAQYAEAFAKWKDLDKQRDNLEKVLNTDISDQAKEEARKSLDDVMMRMATLVDAYR